MLWDTFATHLRNLSSTEGTSPATPAGPAAKSIEVAFSAAAILSFAGYDWFKLELIGEYNRVH